MSSGGYAFPRKPPEGKVSPTEAVDILHRHAGMTVRQLYKTAAVIGMLADGTILRGQADNHESMAKDGDGLADRGRWVAEQAGYIADCMIAEDEKRRPAKQTGHTPIPGG